MLLHAPAVALPPACPLLTSVLLSQLVAVLERLPAQLHDIAWDPGEDFPGAYSGKVSSWERKTRLAVDLLDDQHGYSPGVVLRARAPATTTATAVTMPDAERRQYGKNYIGVREGSTITPRKLAASLNTPAPTVPLPPLTPALPI